MWAYYLKNMAYQNTMCLHFWWRGNTVILLRFFHTHSSGRQRVLLQLTLFVVKRTKNENQTGQTQLCLMNRSLQCCVFWFVRNHQQAVHMNFILQIHWKRLRIFAWNKNSYSGTTIRKKELELKNVYYICYKVMKSLSYFWHLYV
jgi:hypothetical protein